MKRLSILFSILCLAYVMVLPAFAAEESIDNPTYLSWAKFKVGAQVRYRQEMDMAGNKTESEIVYSLVEITPEKAVVEMKVATIIMGNKTEMPATKVEYLAKVPKTNLPQAAAPETQIKSDSKQGDEEIDVVGKKMKCHFIETTTEQNGGPIVSKIYTSDEIPGTLVKSVTNMEKPMKITTTIVLEEVKTE